VLLGHAPDECFTVFTVPLPRCLFDRTPPRDHDLEVRQGAWPEGLAGELVISAPHPRSFGGRHPFFGEGMVHRLSLEPGTHGAPDGHFAWRQALVDSPSARLRTARPDRFRSTMIGVQSPFGHLNAANTAPLPWGDRLFLTWDAGRPVEVDPVSLRFLGEVGGRSEWLALDGRPSLLPTVMTSAHPVVDPERDLLWTVNPHWGELHVVAWDGLGGLRRWPIAGGSIPQSVHTITQTRDWLVVADCAYKVEPQVLAGGPRTEPANPSEPVHLIRKDELLATPPGVPVACRTFVLAPETNHYYATWDDTDGVTVVFEHTESAELSMVQGPDDIDALGRPCDPALAGLYGLPMAPDRTSLLVIDPEQGTIRHRAEQRDPSRLWSRQLNAIDWSTEGRSAPTVHHTVHHGFRPEAITQAMLDLYGDRVDRTLLPAEETSPLLVTTALPDLEVASSWAFGADDLPTSPIFVPRGAGIDPSRSRFAGTDPGGHDGWVVVPVINDGGARVEVFDAGDVARGPLAVLGTTGMVLPLVLHAAWVPEARPAGPEDPAERGLASFADDLAGFEAEGGRLAPDLADVARQVADDLRHGAPLTA
jgi:all-trans-8'-apo-beta-carotenal 15,15'-oxygenase